jgi:DNA-directed RNA polymerase specialized sigma24 family protein
MRTLGDALNVSKAKVRVSEKDWVKLVQSIAARDQLALHSLYEQTHRIVFTLIVRITNNRETAEELTLDVFHDVWRRASTYDPANGSVVGWIMNQARSRAIDRLRFEHRKRRFSNYVDSPLTRLRRMTHNKPATLRSRAASCEMPWRSLRRKSAGLLKPHFFPS